MSPWQAAILGVVQGLTEFFPVSSSAHLVLAQSLLGVQPPGVALETAVHVATLVAVLWVYRGRVGELAVGVARRERDALRYVGLLAVASIPAGVAGLTGRSFFEATFERPTLAAALLIVSGVFVWTLRRTASAATDEEPGVGQSLWVGLAQALAILPGISRSGTTVAAGVWSGVRPVRMAEFSFLLSVPAIGGAALLEADAMAATAGSAGLALVVAFGAALVAGVVAIRLFLRALELRVFYRFGYYCWAVGGAYLLAAWLLPGLP